MKERIERAIKMDVGKAIEAFKMLRELMLFDPTTGDVIQAELLNEDNKDLYDAAHVAIQALTTQMERENPAPLTLDQLRGMEGEPVYLKKLNESAEEKSQNAILISTNDTKFEFAGALGGWFTLFISDYGTDYTAFPHKPKEEK